MHITDSNFSPLLEKGFIPSVPKGRLLLGKDKISWLNETERKETGNKGVPSLKQVVNTIQKIQISKLTLKEYENLAGNLKSLNERVKKHNDEIDHSNYKRRLNSFLSFITFGLFSLKYKNLDQQLNTIQEKQNGIEQCIKYCLHELKEIKDKLEILLFVLRDISPTDKVADLFSQLLPHIADALNHIDEKKRKWMLDQLFLILKNVNLPSEKVNPFYLILRSRFLLLVYRDQSFIKENHLEKVRHPAEIREDQMDLLEKLFLASHKQTLLELQTSPLLREALLEKIKRHKELTKNSDFPMRVFDSALLKIHTLSYFIKTDSLLKVLIYIGSNWTKIMQDTLGKQSKSRPHIYKFAPDAELPLKFEFNTFNAHLSVKLGFLGKGSYKTVYSELTLQNLELKATSKQQLRETTDREKSNTFIAKQEKAMMEAVKGLPHVIQLREAYVYNSKKKAIPVLCLDAVLYDMGELTHHIKTLKENRENQLQVAVDIFEGVKGLHDKKIIHRDLKLKNIFLERSVENGKETPRAHVGDLGLACFIEDEEERKNFKGTPIYLPPEAFTNTNADYTYDAWALGVMLSEMFDDSSPFNDIVSPNDIFATFNRLKDPLQNPEPKDKISIEYVIWKLLRYNPAERMSVNDTLTTLKTLLENEQNKVL